MYGLAQLGSGKGQCILCEQASNNVQSHQCGVLFQLSVMLGQTYDVSHFPVMPVMLRTLPEDRPEENRLSPHLTTTQTARDVRQSESSSAIRKSSASSSKPGHNGTTSLHKCTRCQMAFFSATALTHHMQENHDSSSGDPITAPPAQVQKKLKTSRTIQQMFGLPPAGPIPEAPQQFECPLCLETIGRKALIGHLRREHQAVHTGAFSFVPDHDMIQGSLTCSHCYNTFTMEQALITHVKRGSCPVLMCQWAKAQHFGTTLVTEPDRSSSMPENTLPALLHRYFDLSQAGSEHDSVPGPAIDLMSLWFPMLYAPCWTPLQGMTWFRYTTDWLSHFPEMPHTNFVTDQVFAMIRVLGHQPPLAWAWTLDTEYIPHFLPNSSRDGIKDPLPHWRKIIRLRSNPSWFRVSSCRRARRPSIWIKSPSRLSEVLVDEVEFLFRCSRPFFGGPVDEVSCRGRLKPSWQAVSKSWKD